MNINSTNQQLANAIRSLTIDAIEKSNSGHPGMPLGMADVATILYKDFLKFNSSDPNWPNRDRFVLSAGHGSMLLYSLLYLTGDNEVNIDDIKNFRQLHSKTAGHPEYEMLSAVETTTGPLGQGLANAVGMAFAEKKLSLQFPNLINHYTYTIVGDGCLMEGISQEAITFAAHYKLNKLIVLFDDNNISIDGQISQSSSENQIDRFNACNWYTQKIDGHNYEEITNAIKNAQKSDRPSIIACKTTIGYGSPNKSGKSSSHGSPLGTEEAELTKQNLSIDYPKFEIPKQILQDWNYIGKKNVEQYDIWLQSLKSSKEKEEFLRLINNKLPDSWQEELEKFKKDIINNKPNEATRKSSGNTLEILTNKIPELIGGSADLTGSNNTKTTKTDSITNTDFSGRYIHYGIREHAMAAIMNGIRLHGGFIPYSGTFLVFSDYLKPAMRLSALMEQKVIYVFTHDSIGLGEDGPTHQPIEHLDSIRLIPNITLIRPCDAYETAESWEVALKIKGPVAISLTRQNLPLLNNKYSQTNNTLKGAYIISPEKNKLDGIVIATGSEVEIAISAQKKLIEENIDIRVVSMPSQELFDLQDSSYKELIFGQCKNIIAIEASKSFSFYKYAKTVIGINSFGASGKYKDLYNYFDINEKHIINKIKQNINHDN